MQMAHLVAFQRALAPRQHEAQRQQSKQTPKTGAPGIGPARTRHPQPHPAPYRARRAITPRAENRELAESVEKQNQRNAGKRLGALGLDADQEIYQIDRRQNRERKQKADEELPGGPGVFGGMAIDGRARPQRAADIGGEPEAIKAAGNQFEQRAAAHQAEKVAALAGEGDALRTSDQIAWQRNVVH